MPYRGALETTLARCAQHQERIRDLERELGFPWKPPLEITTDDAVALARTEHVLETRLANLEEERAARNAVNGFIVARENRPTTQPLSWKAVIAATAASFVLLIVVVLAVQFFVQRDASISVYRAGGHTHAWTEHCAVTVTRVRDVCDVEVACVTEARRAREPCVDVVGTLPSHVEGPIDVDTAQSIVRVARDRGEPLVIELDPWKR